MMGGHGVMHTLMVDRAWRKVFVSFGHCLKHVGWVLRDVVQPTPCVPGLRVKQVAAGGMHSCVLTDTGEVSMILLSSCQLLC